MRQAQMFIILGTNRTGKTTLTKQIISGMNRTRKLVLTPDLYEPKWNDFSIIKRSEIPTFEGTKKIIYNKNDFIGLQKNLFDAVLVLDDFGAYDFLNNKEKKALKSLLVRRAQRKLDIFFIAHGFTDIVPTFIFRYASKYIIFKTEDKIDLVKNRIKYYEKMKQAVNRISQNSDPHYYEIIEL